MKSMLHVACILKMTKAGSGVPRSRPLMHQGSRSWVATDTGPWVIVPLLVCYTHAWPAWRNRQHKHLSSIYSKRRRRLQSPSLNPLSLGAYHHHRARVRQTGPPGGQETYYDWLDVDGWPGLFPHGLAWDASPRTDRQSYRRCLPQTRHRFGQAVTGPGTPGHGFRAAVDA